jgi:hypothetical protein
LEDIHKFVILSIALVTWYQFATYKGNNSYNKMNCELMLTYDTPTLWQTGSMNLTGPKNSCWEKCDEKCAYMFNVYKNQLSRQTGSRNLTGPKTLPTIWYTYMMFVTKYQISAINSYWEKCDEKYLGRTEVKQYTSLPLRGAGV